MSLDLFFFSTTHAMLDVLTSANDNINDNEITALLLLDGIRTIARMDTIPNDTIPNGHNPEWTQSRMDTIPNGHNPERTTSRMDTIPNGHNPERTQFRMSTYNYIVTLVFNSYCLVRSLLRRRGFIQKVILCINLSDL